MSAPFNDRPTPLRDAFKTVASARAFLGSLVTALVGWGLLTSVQGDAIVGLLGLIPALITAGTALLAAFGVVSRGEPQVTPQDDPAVVAVNIATGRPELVALQLPAGYQTAA